MRRIVLAVLIVSFATVAEAQIFSCGEATPSNFSTQSGKLRRVHSIVGTSQPTIVGCFYIVQVEMWVEGIAMKAVTARHDSYAEVDYSTPVPAWGTWKTWGKHWRISALGNWTYAGTSLSEADVVFKFDETPETCGMDEYWDGTQCVPTYCPIVLDVGRNGYSLTSPEDGVWFDINADGTPEQIAWTAADSDDAFLAMDRNGNGRIDDGSELFGDATPATRHPETGAWINAANGFEALKFLENPDFGVSQADHLLDAKDAPFSRLLLWRDANHNGISEPDELTPAAAAGLESIHAYDVKTSGRRDAHGNLFRLRAVATFGGRSHYVYDIWLRSR
jgi:hypothetical protein